MREAKQVPSICFARALGNHTWQNPGMVGSLRYSRPKDQSINNVDECLGTKMLIHV